MLRFPPARTMHIAKKSWDAAILDKPMEIKRKHLIEIPFIAGVESLSSVGDFIKPSG